MRPRTPLRLLYRVHAIAGVAIAAVAATTLSWTAGAVAQTTSPAWQVSSGEVTVVCPLTIGGSFEAVTTSLEGTLAIAGEQPSSVDGSLAVDLGTLDTGIGLRTRHLKERYLEIERGEGFARAVLSDIVLDGGNEQGLEGRTGFTGQLAVHGTTVRVTGEADITPASGGRRVRARFPVSLSALDIPPPRYLGVGVRDEVRVEVDFVAAERAGQ